MGSLSRPFVWWLLLASLWPLSVAAQSIDEQLQQEDQRILQYCVSSFERDLRYDQVIQKIETRFNPHIKEVYGRDDKTVVAFVFASTMGFNAMTWDHTIIIDSLLLDSFRRLSEGVTVYGGVDNEYVYKLARAVAYLQLNQNTLPARVNTNTLDNVYGLPVVGSLSPEEKRSAAALFEEMVASWLGHEGSHAFLNHMRERLQADQMRQMYQNNQMGSYIQNYMSYDLGQQKEMEADARGTQLILRSGYTIRGFVLTLQFSDLLEQLTGSSNTYLRTHPPAADRIAAIQRVAASMVRPEGSR